MEMKELVKFAMKNFGELAKALGIAKDLAPKLKKAGIPLTGEEYAALMLFFSVSVPALIALLVSITLIFLGSSLILAFLAFLVVFSILALLIFLGFYVYPDIVISDIQRSIATNLPFATIYLSTLAGAGIPMHRAFKILANFEEFGEISKEAKKITRDVELLGFDIGTALERAANRTPSTQFKELLWGIKSTLTTGGDLRAFLMEKARSYMEDYRRFLDQFVNQLSLLMEIYITLVIVGSIFFIIMGTIMGLIGGGQPLLLSRVVVYFGLPLASIMFMLLIASISPGG